MQQDPAAAQRIAGVVGSVAELDCDIIIDEAPDNLTPQLEQFQALVELKKLDANNEIAASAPSSRPSRTSRTGRSSWSTWNRPQQQQQGPPPEVIRMQIDGAG